MAGYGVWTPLDPTTGEAITGDSKASAELAAQQRQQIIDLFEQLYSGNDATAQILKDEYKGEKRLLMEDGDFNHSNLAYDIMRGFLEDNPTYLQDNNISLPSLDPSVNLDPITYNSMPTSLLGQIGLGLGMAGMAGAAGMGAAGLANAAGIGSGLNGLAIGGTAGAPSAAAGSAAVDQAPGLIGIGAMPESAVAQELTAAQLLGGSSLTPVTLGSTAAPAGMLGIVEAIPAEAIAADIPAATLAAPQLEPVALSTIPTKVLSPAIETAMASTPSDITGGLLAGLGAGDIADIASAVGGLLGGTPEQDLSGLFNFTPFQSVPIPQSQFQKVKPSGGYYQQMANLLA